MKKLVALFVVVTLAFSTFAQKASVQGTPSTMKENVKLGVFQFEMPAATSSDGIERTAKYYVDYFTIDFDAATNNVTVKMIDNSPEGRRVVTRFLLSNKVSVIVFNGSEYKITEFYDNFMKD